MRTGKKQKAPAARATFIEHAPVGESPLASVRRSQSLPILEGLFTSRPEQPPSPNRLLPPTEPAALRTPVASTESLHALLDSQLKQQETGLQAAHLEKILGVCRAFDLIIAFRPVNPLAGYLLAPLNYPTKPFGIKCKTDRSGPAAGHIQLRMDPLTNAPIGTGLAVALPLELTGERINQLIQQKILVPTPLEPPILHDREEQLCDELVLTCYFFAERWHFRRVPCEQSAYLQHHGKRGGIWQVWTTDADGKPANRVKVLGHPILRRPFTADYDLLTFGSRDVAGELPLNSQPPIPVENDFLALANARRMLRNLPPIGGASSGEVTGQQTPDAQIADVNRTQLQLPERFVQARPSETPQEDPMWGNASPLLRAIAHAVNSVINRGNTPLLNLIQHNADCHNPFSNESGSYPALFLLPNAVALDRDALLNGASADARLALKQLGDMCSSIVAETGATDAEDSAVGATEAWHNWGAVWVLNASDFNQLAMAAKRRGYSIHKSPAWLGGELPGVTNRSRGIR